MICLTLRRITAPLRRLMIAAWGAALVSGCAMTLVPPLEPVDRDPPPAFEPPPQTPAEPPSAPRGVVVIAPPEPIDPLRPEEPVNLDSEEAHADLWGRIRRGFAIPDFDNDLVRERERWYSTRPDYVQRMTERGSRYLFHIVEEVQRRNMPTELALLPFIESAFNPQAMSSAKASGMWQFIPSTGRHFDLKQNIFRDDRRDVLASTRAALDYLGRLHAMFGDWHLALAAYNWGEGNVQRAISRNQKSGLPTDYASLRMPAETRHYVPKLQAVKNIIARPEAYSLSLPALANHPYFLSVPITRDIDVDLAARLAGMSVDDFKNLNPQMNGPVILAAGTPHVLLPYDNANWFVKEIAKHRDHFATWTAWVVPKTLHPAEAAKRAGMSESQLREINGIPPRMLVKGGSTLLVPRTVERNADVAAHIAQNAVMTLAPDAPAAQRVFVRARHKDTVSTVARRYKVQPAEVAQWNRVSAAASFKPGQTIVLHIADTALRSLSPRTTAVRKSVAVKSAGIKAKRPSRAAATARTAAKSTKSARR